MNCKGNIIAARDYMLNAALAKTDTRRALQHVYSDGATAVATNGKVLCYAPMDLPAGFYDIATAGTGRNKATRFVPMTDSEELVFPNWKQVVPDCTKAVKTFDFAAGSEKVEREIFKLQFALASFETGSLIAQEYIDLMRKTELVYHVSVIDGMLPVVFDASGIFTLVVMPRREKDNTEIGGIMEAFKSEAVREWKATRDAAEGRPRVEPEVLEPTAPDDMPEADAPKAALMPKAAKKQRKASFRYVCELESGETITLGSVKEVEARGDVLKCRIEPVKRQRKEA